MAKITAEERRRRLAHRHRLTPSEAIDDVATIADDLVAFHASDPATVFLSALVRMANPNTEGVHAALKGMVEALKTAKAHGEEALQLAQTLKK